jgi:hypothetical protein
LSCLHGALDRSLADASAFTRSPFEHDTLDAESVVRLVDSVRNFIVSTVTASGDPHAKVVIAACVDADIHFTVSDRSVMQRKRGPSSWSANWSRD